MTAGAHRPTSTGDPDGIRAVQSSETARQAAASALRLIADEAPDFVAGIREVLTAIGKLL